MRLMEACLALLEREEAREQSDADAIYRPVIPAIFRIPDALARMRRQLAVLTAPTPLVAFLPQLPAEAVDRDLVARSAVSSTLIAALELARTAELVLGEGATFEEVTATGRPSDRFG
jgi:hypothetical protein